MFEKERAEIRILSNIADAQGLGRARDLLRQAEHEFEKRAEWYAQQLVPQRQRRLDLGDE